MNKIDSIIAELKSSVEHPGKVVKQYKKKGIKSIGCFPVYCPEEIIHAAGLMPIGIWGGQTEINQSKQYLPAFACSIMQSCLEYGLKGTYDDLAAVIIPGMCDTLICMGQNWKEAVKQIEYISLVYPQNRKIEGGIKFLKSEFSRIKLKMEEISGTMITEEKLKYSIEVYNRHRETMRSFVGVASDYPNIITPYIRNIVIKSGYFMEKPVHTELVLELISEIKKEARGQWQGKRILLSGILADSKDLLGIFADNQLAVVADDLAQETRQFRYDVSLEGADELERLARYWSIFEGCSLAYDPDKKRGSIIVDDVRRHSVDGVVFCMMKFCDPEEYDYPLIKKELDKHGIPSLYLEIDQQMDNNEQARTRIQTFAEMLKNIN